VANYAIRHRADVLVVAGDIQTARVGENVSENFRGSFLAPVRKLMDHCIEVVAIPGNHDFYLRDCLGADNRKRFMSNLHILCDRKADIFGVKFYGTPWVPPINGTWAYEAEERDLSYKFGKIPYGIDILISHSPPIGCYFKERWDISTQHDQRYWRHFGSRELRNAIHRAMPKCVVCGHIHSGDHGLNRIDDTAIINCSLVDERYQESYEPAEILVSFGDDGSKSMKFRTEGSKKWATL
jgi:Icc-related predicted phosphoesterase